VIWKDRVMGLPLLFRLPDDSDSWNAWAFNHAAIHYTIIRTIAAQKTQTLTQYPLDPIDPNDLGFWLYQHQVMHNQANAALGTSGYDLLSLDWSQPADFQEWLQLNGDEHRKWGGILGVG
jgi:hypothetical protein